MTDAVHVTLDEVIGSLQVYARGLLGEEIQLVQKTHNNGNERAVESVGKISITLPKVMDAFRTRELNELYLKFLVTFDVSRHLFGSFFVNQDALEGRLRSLERERKEQVQLLEEQLLQEGKKRSREAVTIREHIRALKEKAINFSALKNCSSVREILQELVDKDNGVPLVTCYELVELARVSYLMRERWPGLSGQMDRLFAEGARNERASVKGIVYEPQKNSLVDQLGLYAVAPDMEHKGKDGEQTRLVRSEGVRFFEPVRKESATAADSVVQAIMLHRWVKSKYRENTLLMLPASLPGVAQCASAKLAGNETQSARFVERRRAKGADCSDVLYFDEFDVKSGAYVKRFCRVSVRDDGLYGHTFKRTMPQKGMFPFKQGVLDEIVAAFEEVRPEARAVRKKEKSGELDSDRVVDYILDIRNRRTPDERVYEQVLKANRDVAVAVLVDASGSMNRFLTKEVKIFDVVRESVFYLSQGLDVLGDEYAIFAHRSRSAYDVQLKKIKGLGEKVGFAQIIRKLADLSAEKNNHDGAVIRYATQVLDNWQARTKFIIHLSDGEPKDVPLAVFERERDTERKQRGSWRTDGYAVPTDHNPFKKFPYQGERAWADVKKAVYEASLRGIRVCHVRVSEEPSVAAMNVFGRNQVFVRDVNDLARELPKFYFSVTR